MFRAAGPDVGGDLLPDERDHVAVAADRAPWSAARSSPTDRSTCTTRSMRVTRGRRRARARRRRRWRPRPAPASTPARGAAVVGRRRRRSARGRARARGARPRSGLERRRWPLELDIDALLGGARRDRAFRAAVALPGVEHRPRVRARRARVRRRRRARRCGPRSATCSRTVRVLRRVPFRRARAGRRSLAFALRLPGAGPHAHRRRDRRRCARRAIDAWSRPRTTAELRG